VPRIETGLLATTVGKARFGYNGAIIKEFEHCPDDAFEFAVDLDYGDSIYVGSGVEGAFVTEWSIGDFGYFVA